MPRHLGGLVDVAQVDDDRSLHQQLDTVEVQGPELVPFGQDDQGVGALGGFVGAGLEVDRRQ